MVSIKSNIYLEAFVRLVEENAIFPNSERIDEHVKLINIQTNFTAK
jgi:hypothetical protein